MNRQRIELSVRTCANGLWWNESALTGEELDLLILRARPEDTGIVTIAGKSAYDFIAGLGRHRKIRLEELRGHSEQS